MSRTVKVLIWLLIGIPLFLIVSLFIAFQVFVNISESSWDLEKYWITLGLMLIAWSQK